MVTVAVSSNPNTIYHTDGGTARELLCITESAVDAVSLKTLNSRRSGAGGQKSDSSFVTVQTKNLQDVENSSTDSRSSTASEILRRSTHASAAFSVPSSLPGSSESVQSVRLPVKVLREVPVPHDGKFAVSLPTSRDNFKSDCSLQRKTRPLANADWIHSDEAAERGLDKKLKQDSSRNMESSEFPVSKPKISKKPSASGVEVEAGDRIMPNELSGSSPVHPLMAILDSGCLTQPIHTIIPEKWLSSGDSHCTSMRTSASPIEVVAKDGQTSRFLKTQGQFIFP